MTSPKFVGRGAVLEYSIADETATVGSLSWSVLGSVRSKSWKGKWDTVDVTADTSAGHSKEMLTTFFGVEFSCDGVSYGESIAGQKALLSHFYNPPIGTQYTPKTWFRLTDPDGTVRQGPFILTEMSDDRPYSDGATWSLTASSNGQPTYTPT
jgi:predicted secreted protein